MRAQAASRCRWRPLLAGTLILATWGGSTRATAAPADDPYRAVNDSWERFGSVYGRIVEDYYDSLGQAEVMRAAIEGMLTKLDSYSQFFDQEGLRQLRQDTSGRFAGLGITVGLKDRYPIVIAAIPETPAEKAGIVAGDQIIQVEGQDTRGWPLEQVVRVLRGDPGSRVNLKVVHRGGTTTTRELSVVREVIRIRSVNLVTEAAPGIGYISLRQTRFSEDTAQEVERALTELEARSVQAVVLDLRGNPGGLLSQAVAAASLFLPPGAPIVSIHERDGRRDETKFSEGRPVAEKLPLAVLVDGGSASASEIVAGAIQDNDRGVILGTTTFGKGSVQTVFDLYDDTSALKLTTARYYTPSGRSIHRELAPETNGPAREVIVNGASLPALPALGLVVGAGSAAQAVATLRARFDLDPAQAALLLEVPLRDLLGWSRDTLSVLAAGDSTSEPEFRTKRGRPVHGGGGITPDLVVREAPTPVFVQELERRRVFFDFVIDLVAEDSLAAVAIDTVGPGSALLSRFLAYPATQAVARDTESQVRRHLRAIRTIAAEMEWDPALSALTDHLEAALSAQSLVPASASLAAHLSPPLKRELLRRLHGSVARSRVDLAQDQTLQAAVRLLADEEELARLLAQGVR